MQRVPRIIVGASAASVLLLLGFGVWMGFRPTVPAAPAAPRADAAATAPALPTPAKPVFVFSDDTIYPLADDRQNQYTFYIENQFIGVILMSPKQDEGAGAPESFAAWIAGLDGAIQIGGEPVPVESVRVAGHDAIGFVTDLGPERAENLMTEVDGRVLLIQSKTDRGVLERFLEKLQKIEDPA